MFTEVLVTTITTTTTTTITTTCILLLLQFYYYYRPLLPYTTTVHYYYYYYHHYRPPLPSTTTVHYYRPLLLLYYYYYHYYYYYDGCSCSHLLNLPAPPILRPSTLLSLSDDVMSVSTHYYVLRLPRLNFVLVLYLSSLPAPYVPPCPCAARFFSTCSLSLLPVSPHSPFHLL